MLFINAVNASYERDLDLNLLRVFVVVAETGSITGAASRLYLTQPAVSAAIGRLTATIGAKLFVREGRGIRLTSRGEKLLVGARPHLEALLHATQSPAAFAPEHSDRTVRLGLSDATDTWLLPPLLHVLAREAPNMKLVVLPVQFRTVASALATSTIDCAVTIADDLPAGTGRATLFSGGFTCLYDPRHADIGKKLTLARYVAHHHVVVSYNGDLRGIVEDLLGVVRKARVSVPSFQGVGAIVDGSALLATVPETVADAILNERPNLRKTRLPFVEALRGSAMELVWRRAIQDDGAIAFVMDHIKSIATRTWGPSPHPRSKGSKRS
jgi:LysR family transcriptional regulator, mexEF-oprN operon transcriptional activator